eukprot:scaffold107956_cov69-Phaeocystis_antarctica.AAC.1
MRPMRASTGAAIVSARSASRRGATTTTRPTAPRVAQRLERSETPCTSKGIAPRYRTGYRTQYRTMYEHTKTRF